MKLRYHVKNRYGTDAERWARDRAVSTYQTPVEVFSVYDMRRTTKVNGRLVGTLLFEWESWSVDQALKR